MMKATANDRAGPGAAMVRSTLRHLNVRSPFLVHIYNLSRRVSGKWLKQVIERDVGRIVFVETFEAWKPQGQEGIGSLVFEFDDAATMEKFLNMPKGWIAKNFKGIPTAREMEGEEDRALFFATILNKTGVDLYGTQGVPPSTWTERVIRGRQGIRGPPPSRVEPYRQQGLPFRSELSFQRDNPRPQQMPMMRRDRRLDGSVSDTSVPRHHVVIENIPFDCTADELESLLIYTTPLSVYITRNRNGNRIGIARFSDERDAEQSATFWSGEELRHYKIYAMVIRDNDERVEPIMKKEEEGSEEVPLDFDLIKLND